MKRVAFGYGRPAEMKVVIAAQALTKILVLGHDKYDDVREGLLCGYAST